MYELRSLCRTCGVKIEELTATNLFEERNCSLLQLLEDISDLCIEYDNSLPEYICDGCVLTLDGIVQFRNHFLNTHKHLLATREELQRSDCASPFENEIVEEDDFGDADAISKAQSLEDSHASSKKVVDMALRENGKINQATGNKSKKTPTKKKKTWVCELCGGEFKHNTYLKLHLLRHTGKKDFECDICKAKYYTENEMKRHRILHSDARPYACRFCSKTFRGRSSKAVHERSHTNERPFACHYCDKTFRSTSVRRSHELVHTNKRKYHCEICDQWYLRSTHLSIHKHTKQHKKKAEELMLA